MTSPLVSNREQRKFMEQMALAVAPTTRLLGIPLPDWRKGTSRNAVLTATATGGDMGLASSAGFGMVGTSTNNTSATDGARIEIRLPDNYAAAGAITFNLRGRVAINRQVTQTITVSVKEVLDSTVGAELNTSEIISVVTAYTNYPSNIITTGLTAGSILAITLTAINNDTGGSGGASAIIVTKTWLEFAGT